MADKRKAASAPDEPPSTATTALAAMAVDPQPLRASEPFMRAPTAEELEAAALAIALPAFTPSVRRPKKKEHKRPRTRQRQRVREYIRRKDPLARVRENLPRVVRRRGPTDAVGLDWYSEEDKKVLRKVQRKVETEIVRCHCIECRVSRRLNKVHRFRCTDQPCAGSTRFDHLLELVEHQMTHHGSVSLRCPRVVETLGHELRKSFSGTPVPPPSVYVYSQFTNPAVRPELWTEKASINRERPQVYAGAKYIINFLARIYVVAAFETAALKVELVGDVELASQYEMALAFHNSALVHQPGDAFMVDDGSFAVGPGRNWLLSADPENAQYLNQFEYHWGRQAGSDDEDEIVLFST